ncbi:MAG: hypothetical protein R2852_03730 [Bacteroidia bacterium]
MHRRMVKNDWSDKSKMGDYPLLLANKLSYTYQHVINNINKDDWYSDIYNYIDYTVESFGSFPYQYGGPLYIDYYYKSLINLISNIAGIEANKKKLLISLINQFAKPSIKNDKG